MHFHRNPFTCSCERGQKGLNALKFGTFIGRFQSDGAAGMAVKGLIHDNGTESTSDVYFSIFNNAQYRKREKTIKAMKTKYKIKAKETRGERGGPCCPTLWSVCNLFP